MARYLSLLLAAAVSVAVLPARAAPAEAADSGLTPQILYQFLIGEVAGQRGQFGLAASAHLDLAKSSRHPAVARRAAEVALHTRQFDIALEAARLWTELAPEDPAARQLLANVLVATNRIDDLAVALQRDLAAAGPNVDALLLRLNRLFARFPDKLAVQRLVEQVTVPYVSRPEAHFARAQSALNARKPERARESIDEALRLRPNWEMAAVFKAQVLERGTELVSFLQGFLAANPEARDARLAYARALVAEKRYAESRAEFRTLQEVFPDNGDIHYAIGILSLQLDDPRQAEVHLSRFLEIGGNEANAARFYLGQIAEDDKRYDEALRRFDQVDGGEHQTAALLRSTQILTRQGRIDEARQRLARARSLLPQDAPRLFIAESQLLKDAGRNEASYAVLQEALARQPDQPDLLYEAALAVERLDRLADAERYLRRLIALKPDSAQGYNALGYSLADRGLRLDEALQLIDKALSLAPDDPFILDSKGWVLFRLGRLAEALDYLQRAYAQRRDPEIAAHIGEVLWAMGRRDDAATVWREASQAFPANAVLSATIKRFVP